MATHRIPLVSLLPGGLWSRPTSLPRSRTEGGLLIVLATLFALLVAPTRSLLSEPQRNEPPIQSSESPAEFTIRLKGGQVRYRQGEAITLELGYGASPAARVSRYPLHSDRPGLAVDEFLLEPRAGVADPLRDFLGSVGVWDGPPPRLEPFVEAGGAWQAVEINEWFRFDQPGRYRLAVLAHPARSSYEAFGNRAPGAAAASNTVEFEIVPADDAWKAATLQKAVTLAQAKSDAERQLQGCRLLRFLTTRAAVDAMVQHYADEGVCEAEYRYGLFAFPDRDYAVRRMEDGLLGPSVAVSADYLRTLATLTVYRQHPEYLPTDSDQFLGKTDWSISGPLAAHWDQIEREQNHYVEELLGALGDKTRAARAVSLKAIFDSPLLGKPTLLVSADPALLDRLRKQLAGIFPSLPVSDQSMMLYARWENIRSPAMIPVLKDLYANPPAGAGEQFTAVALERLDDLDPAEGRALILAEMERPHPRLDMRFVHLLPDRQIPELDEPLAENLEASGGREATIVELIGRYATPAIFPRVRALLEARVGALPCEAQASLVAYAFSSDAVAGAEMLGKALAAREGTSCYKSVLGEVASRRMTPEIEQAAIARLNDPDIEVATGAAGTLGRFGSPDAEQPLWDRLARWHAAWVGRAADLPDGYGSALRNGLQTGLEDTLIGALGEGQNWFAGPEKLARLRGLCVSSGGCRRVDEMIHECANLPIINAYRVSQGQYSAIVNQYHLESLDRLKEKLAQFPEGTIFQWSFSGDTKDGASALAEIRAFLEQHGMTVE